MQLLPDARSSRLTAILLAVVALIVIYLVGFHWFAVSHAGYAEEVRDLRAQLGRFEAVAGQRDALESRLREARASRQDQGLFLPGGDFNEAGAALSARLGDITSRLAGEDCQIVSRAPVPSRVEERYERVTVNVRMRCEAEDLVEVLHELESEIPMVIVDDMNVTRPRMRRRVQGQIVETTGPLDVRFDMFGYLGR